MWRFTLNGHTFTKDDQTLAGEWELVYLEVNRIGFPHDELQIHPAHCPSCRNGIAVALLIMRGAMDRDAAIAFVASLRASLLVDAIEVIAPTPPEGMESDDEPVDADLLVNNAT